MSSTTDNCLIVFCRAPEMGRVKSRLAEQLGEQGALDAYRQLVAHAIGQVAEVEAAKVLATTAEHAECDRWAGTLGGEIVYQCGDDLGARMANAMAGQFERGYQHVLLMGVDCPPLDAASVRQGFDLLAAADVVLAPAEDGGYGLVGSRALQPAIFRDVAWGECYVLQRTLDVCQAENLKAALLPQIWDVDDREGWQRFIDFRRVARPDAGPENG